MKTLRQLSTWPWFVALGWVLLTPGVGLASEAEVSPGAMTSSPQPLSAAPLVDAPREESGGRRVGRIATEVGLMAAISVVAGIPGMFIGATSLGEPSESPVYIPNLDGAGRGFLVGAAVGAPLGVWLGGRVAQGRGTFGSVLLGAGAGGGLGLLASTLVPQKHADIAPFLFPAFAMAGSLIGYEVSHASNMAPPAHADEVTLLPALALDAKGSVLGLSGRF